MTKDKISDVTSLGIGSLRLSHSPSKLIQLNNTMFCQLILPNNRLQYAPLYCDMYHSDTDRIPFTSCRTFLAAHYHDILYIAVMISLFLLFVRGLVASFNSRLRVAQDEPKAFPGTLATIKRYNILRLALCVILFSLHSAFAQMSTALTVFDVRLSFLVFSIDGLIRRRSRRATAPCWL